MSRKLIADSAATVGAIKPATAEEPRADGGASTDGEPAESWSLSSAIAMKNTVTRGCDKVARTGQTRFVTVLIEGLVIGERGGSIPPTKSYAVQLSAAETRF